MRLRMRIEVPSKIKWELASVRLQFALMPSGVFEGQMSILRGLFDLFLKALRLRLVLRGLLDLFFLLDGVFLILLDCSWLFLDFYLLNLIFLRLDSRYDAIGALHQHLFFFLELGGDLKTCIVKLLKNLSYLCFRFTD